MPKLEVVTVGLLPPPYPADTRAGNYAMRLDMGRVHQSTTYLLASRPESPPELRPWLIFLWCEAWQQIPMASLPDSDDLVAAILGMPTAYFAVHKTTLMRGWRKHADERLYHDFLTGLVLATLRERARYKRHREQVTTIVDTITGESEPAQITDIQTRNVAPLLPQRADVDVKVEANTKPKNKDRATRLPKPWTLPDEWLAWATGSEGMTEAEAVRQSLIFRDHWHSTNKNPAKLDWFATWRNWCRRLTQ